MQIIDYNEIEKPFKPMIGTCYSNVPNHIYHGLKEFESSSTLKYALRSREFYEYKKSAPNETTLSMEKGSAFHYGIEQYVNTMDYDLKGIIKISKKTINCKEYEEAKKEDNIVLPESDIDDVRYMIDNAIDKGNEWSLFNDCNTELSFFWNKFKTRPDLINFNKKYIVDYKTTKAETIQEFKSDAGRYKYHLSAYMYIQGVSSVFKIPIEDYLFLTVCNTPPFECHITKLSTNSILRGFDIFSQACGILTSIELEDEIQTIDIY